MENSNSAWLRQMQALVCRQHEMVPFLQKYHPVDSMAFRPLPDEMLGVLRYSPDWSEPAPSVPVLMMLEADHASGGVMIVREPVTGAFHVLVPVKD